MSALDNQVGGGHYKDLAIQPVEYMHANKIPFIEGCIIKYATRWRDKGGVQDLEKIVHFAQLLIDLEKRSQCDSQRHPMTPNVLEFDEDRADVIGQNGNDGDHYVEVQTLAEAEPRRVPVPGMTDPRNWRAGDWVECVKDISTGAFVCGRLYRVRETKTEFGSLGLLLDEHGSRTNGVPHKFFRFHARPDADGWIKWEGGECPVGADVKVDIRTNDGEEESHKAGGFTWRHDGAPHDIAYYRPHLAKNQHKG